MTTTHDPLRGALKVAEECKRRLETSVRIGHPNHEHYLACIAAIDRLAALAALASPSPATGALRERIALLETALTEVLEFQSAHAGPHIFDWGRWRRIRDNTPPFKRAASQVEPEDKPHD